MVEDYYWYWLCAIPKVSRRALSKLLDYYGDAKSIYSSGLKDAVTILGEDARALKHIKDARDDEYVYRDYCMLADKGISFVHRAHEAYPEKLRFIADAPIGLFYKGKLPDANKLSVAIIGARGCTEYGRQVAYELGKGLAYMGIQVISGMALGIDAAGQNGCLSGGGESFAVLGSGVDKCYPMANISLYNSLLSSGGVISEYLPGSTAMSYCFPERNRIISGLSDAVIVVEARKKSGSLITVEQALDQGREIMAVPGRIGDPLSEGCNELIKAGAIMVTQVRDVCDSDAVKLWLQQQIENKKIPQEQDNSSIVGEKIKNFENNSLASDKNMLYSLLNLYPKDMNTLLRETGMDMAKLNCLLLELQLSGAIKEVGKNSYIRCGL